MLDHVAGIRRLPAGAVLITFDDGYRDILENALPVLRRHGYPAVIFVPIGYLDDARPLPHEEHLAAEGIVNPTLNWDELPELEAGGIRVESHGISHRPLADLEVDEAAREITLSKLRLEERLGRPVRAFAYVKGSEAHYRPVHLEPAQAGGLRHRVHLGLGREHGPRATRCGSTATTSSRTRTGPSSSCSRAPAT